MPPLVSPLTSPRLGLATRLDLVEDGGDGTVVPVDYKKGHPNRDGRAWPSDRMQSLVQALLLREEGYAVEWAEIWYAETRQRVHIAVDDAAMQEITDTVARAWRVASDPVAPPPLRDSPKCARCSLVGICLPDELEALKTPPRQRRPLKRLMAPVLEGRPVYVTLQGATVGVRSDRLEVRSSGELQASYRLIDVSQVCVFGNVTVSAQGVRALLSRDIPVLWFSYGGWFSGMAEGLPGKNVDLRIAQFRASEEQQLEIARRMISGKIRNSRTMLRRNARAELGRVGDQLKELAIQARQADSPQQLLGIEGTAARLYFASFPAMVGKGSRVDVSDFQGNGRTRRPPKDPLNALLSFCYTLLVKDLTVTLSGIGFDPYYGMFHRPRFGRPALALDLAEEFRPLIAESVVLQVLNNGEVGPRDFRSRAGGCMLEASGRKAVLRAYERRLDQEITHPQFGYKASYRRVMDIQARVLGAVVLGELDEYTAMVTR
ncbi:CRISPR-associated endonuclease Cas4g/Cas1g [Actinomyces glycerinitolerans]|uniref:CRISPR-associated endonuclease Cas4g/Cas1g n=1 Tax=Actinomyces glycerinitolerans TaxID=1892869 RepID=UPI0032AFBB86